MAVWLKKDQSGIATEGGIIRRDAWLHAGALDASLEAVGQLRVDAVREAEQQASAIIEAAYQHAEAIRLAAEDAARQLFDQANESGLQAGIDAWTATLLRSSRDTQQQLRLQRERMARLVISAVEKIVPLQNPQGIYLQVLKMLSKSMQAVRYVTVRVCPDEVAFAQISLRDLAAGSPFAKLMEVTADERLGRGACLVESDQGIIDLSLGSQLQALRTAISLSVVEGGASAQTRSEIPQDA